MTATADRSVLHRVYGYDMAASQVEEEQEDFDVEAEEEQEEIGGDPGFGFGFDGGYGGKDEAKEEHGLGGAANKANAKYQHLKQIDPDYKGEEKNSSLTRIEIVKKAKDWAKGDPKFFVAIMIRKFGWTKDEVDKYTGDNREKTKVKYLDENERKEYEVTPGGSLKQHDEAFTTKDMTSTFSGPGAGIFVMSPNGEFYSASHKPALFHHSSFLGGLPTAGAGDWKVKDGSLKEITNKSGHYKPDAISVQQTLQELQDSGVPLGGVDLKLLSETAAELKFKFKHLKDWKPTDPFPGGPLEFLRLTEDMEPEEEAEEDADEGFGQFDADDPFGF